MKLSLHTPMDVTLEQRREWQMPTVADGELVRAFALCDYGIELNANLFPNGNVDVFATHSLGMDEVYSTTLFDLIIDDAPYYGDDLSEFADMLEATAKRLREFKTSTALDDPPEAA